VSALLGATAALPVPSAAAVAQLDVAVQPAGEQHFDFGAAGHPVESEAAAGSSASGSGWDLLEAAQSAALGAGGELTVRFADGAVLMNEQGAQLA
jgi:hypothetical protein